MHTNILTSFIYNDNGLNQILYSISLQTNDIQVVILRQFYLHVEIGFFVSNGITSGDQNSYFRNVFSQRKSDRSIRCDVVYILRTTRITKSIFITINQRTSKMNHSQGACKRDISAGLVGVVLPQTTKFFFAGGK